MIFDDELTPQPAAQPREAAARISGSSTARRSSSTSSPCTPSPAKASCRSSSPSWSTSCRGCAACGATSRGAPRRRHAARASARASRSSRPTADWRAGASRELKRDLAAVAERATAAAQSARPQRRLPRLAGRLHERRQVHAAQRAHRRRRARGGHALRDARLHHTAPRRCPRAARSRSPTPSASSTSCRTAWSRRSSPRSTKSREADLLLHVVDASAEQRDAQIAAVREVLARDRRGHDPQRRRLQQDRPLAARASGRAASAFPRRRVRLGAGGGGARRRCSNAIAAGGVEAVRHDDGAACPTRGATSSRSPTSTPRSSASGTPRTGRSSCCARPADSAPIVRALRHRASLGSADDG